jgi:subtilisin family serine protease
MEIGIHFPGIPDRLVGEVIPKSVGNTHAPEAWAYTKGRGARVGVLSAGIADHDELNVVERVNFCSTEKDPLDLNGHGTSFAGMLAAKQNGIGLMGVAPEADLVSVKVLNYLGRGTIEDLRAAFDWCLTAELDVLTIDFGGGSECDDAIKNSFTALAERGTIIVTGHSESNGRPSFPGCCNSVISAIGQPSTWVTEKADVRSTVAFETTTALGNSYHREFFYPVAMVAGAATLIKSVASNMLVEDLRKLLISTSEDFGPDIHPYKQLNVLSAIMKIIRP